VIKAEFSEKVFSHMILQKSFLSNMLILLCKKHIIIINVQNSCTV